MGLNYIDPNRSIPILRSEENLEEPFLPDDMLKIIFNSAKNIKISEVNKKWYSQVAIKYLNKEWNALQATVSDLNTVLQKVNTPSAKAVISRLEKFFTKPLEKPPGLIEIEKQLNEHQVVRSDGNAMRDTISKLFYNNFFGFKAELAWTLRNLPDEDIKTINSNEKIEEMGWNYKGNMNVFQILAYSISVILKGWENKKRKLKLIVMAGHSYNDYYYHHSYDDYQSIIKNLNLTMLSDQSTLRRVLKKLLSQKKAYRHRNEILHYMKYLHEVNAFEVGDGYKYWWISVWYSGIRENIFKLCSAQKFDEAKEYMTKLFRDKDIDIKTREWMYLELAYGYLLNGQTSKVQPILDFLPDSKEKIKLFKVLNQLRLYDHQASRPGTKT